MKVREIMSTDPTTVAPDDDLAIARQLILWEGIRHLPVVVGGEVVGILSERDLERFEAEALRAGKFTVDDAMEAPVFTVLVDDDVEYVIRELASLKIGCVPVLDTNKKLVGILTTTDILADERIGPRST